MRRHYIAAMRRGLCVKCGAATVRHAVNGLAMGDDAHTLVRPHIPAGFRGAARLHRGQVEAYACTSCGYLELAVTDAATLAFIAESWEPVAPAAPTMPPPG